MDMIRIGQLYRFYQKYLLDNCVPFWMKNSLDNEFGGYNTCLDRTGSIYNTDKSVWFQGRGTWMFSKLYNTVGKKQEWLEAAKSGYDFIKAHCYDTDGRMFFTVTRDGRPLQKRRYMFSETFSIIGLAEYSGASGDIHALNKAKETFELVTDIYKNPWKAAPKIDPATRSLKSLSLPMILLSTIQELRQIENTDIYDTFASQLVNTIFNDFLKMDEHALFESVGLKGERIDSPQGRCINPGHSIETAWFLLQEGLYKKDTVIIKKALNILDWSIEIGWDREFGGILSFVDIEGKPPEQLEWDMKLWWPHTEALYAFLLAYSITDNTKYLKWYERIHDWSFNHFEDKEYGEWFGYLHRDGTVSNYLKGSIWKGMFHLPRALLLNYKLLEKMLQK